MFQVDDKTFEELVNKAIDAIPKKYLENLNNVAIVVEEVPNEEQRRKLSLHPGQTLYGLYEGIPLTKRGAGYNLVLPDKISIFKQPIEAASQTLKDVAEQVRYTMWHEVAHFYGLDHERIHQLDGTSGPRPDHYSNN